MLAMAKTTVSTATRALIDKGLIRPMGDGRKDILYYAYSHKEWIKPYITGHVLTNGGAVGTARKYVPSARAHLSGGALWFTVLSEGLRVIPSLDDPSIKVPLFDGGYQIKGSFNHTGALTFDNERYGLRYQETTQGNRYLAISPPELVQTAEQLSEGDLTPFVLAVRPILDALSKADWHFLKTGANYDYRGKADIEYGLDDTLSTVLEPIIPPGTPGESTLWADKSPGAWGTDGEIESRKPDLVRAIMSADRTAAIVKNTAENLQLVKLEVSEMVSVILGNHDLIKAMVRNIDEITNLMALREGVSL
jgi:hypothetical protein